MMLLAMNGQGHNLRDPKARMQTPIMGIGRSRVAHCEVAHRDRTVNIL